MLSGKMPLQEETLLKKIKSRSLIGYVQCNIEVAESPREAFKNFPPILQHKNIGRDDNTPFMKKCAEKEGLLIQPKTMLI